MDEDNSPKRPDPAEEVASQAAADVRHLVDRPGLLRLIALAESVQRGESRRRRVSPPRRSRAS